MDPVWILSHLWLRPTNARPVMERVSHLFVIFFVYLGERKVESFWYKVHGDSTNRRRPLNLLASVEGQQLDMTRLRNSMTLSFIAHPLLGAPGMG